MKMRVQVQKEYILPTLYCYPNMLHIRNVKQRLHLI